MKIKLSGRIDSSNATEIENEIKEQVGDYKGEIVVDASELEYISSAGLRVILRLKKINDSTKLIKRTISINVCVRLCNLTKGATIGSIRKANAARIATNSTIPTVARIFAALGEINASLLPTVALPLHFCRTAISFLIFCKLPDVF